MRSQNSKPIYSADWEFYPEKNDIKVSPMPENRLVWFPVTGVTVTTEGIAPIDLWESGNFVSFSLSLFLSFSAAAFSLFSPIGTKKERKKEREAEKQGSRVDWEKKSGTVET